jgi:gliding motility-associated-like protein
LLIFNRWGDLIYKTDNINKPWNGKTTNETEAETGVYIWKITLRDVFRKAHEYSGHVTLIR